MFANGFRLREEPWNASEGLTGGYQLKKTNGAKFGYLL
jgi:hypothetical protein